MQMIPIMTAFAQGKEIEVKSAAELEWCPATDPTFRDYYEYRIKPEPKLRPWKPEEVPLDAWLKRDTETWRRINSTYIANEMRYVCLGSSSSGYSTVELFETFTHSLDGGKTWHPCGVAE